MKRGMLRLLCLGLILCSNAGYAQAKKVKSISMYGEPKYSHNFTHFDYVNPSAPKGGAVKFAAYGSFDSFNPFIIKGNSADGISMNYDSLATAAEDETLSEYGLIAEYFEVSPDNLWIKFYINPQAKFSDNHDINAEDVVFSFNILKEKGNPFYRSYYGGVKNVEAIDNKTVIFNFKDASNRELPFILGQMPILPKHYWRDKEFDKVNLDIPVTSGPYIIKDFSAGRYITYERNKEYWAKDLPVNKGRYNFDTIRYDYYMDYLATMQAFAAGAIDIRVESSASKWATSYDFPAVKDGKVVKGMFERHTPSGMQGFAYNTRRPIFSDINLRKALLYVFDYEWANKNLFYGQYSRTTSYFDNSELASKGKISKDELELLAPFKSLLPQDIFTSEYITPTSDGSGDNRPNLRKAVKILTSNGYSFKNGDMVDKKGTPLEFEILLNATDAPTFGRVIFPFIKNLKKIGIKAHIRAVDANIYKNRLDDFDYDMMIKAWGQSLSPGNEQYEFWGSEAANNIGSQNYAGINNPAIDAIIGKIVSAKNKEELVTAVRALDRCLLFGYYVLPHWYLAYDRIAYWNKFGIPEVTPIMGTSFSTWWYKGDIK